MRQSLGHWGDLTFEAARGPLDDWAHGPHASERVSVSWRQREFPIIVCSLRGAEPRNSDSVPAEKKRWG